MDTDFYFSFGSNILTKRIQLQNKSAIKYSIGYLKGYRLYFSGYSKVWNGAVANIEENEKSITTGMIWQINKSDLSSLDLQEVGYERIRVNINTDEGKTIKCWTYIQKPETREQESGDLNIPKNIPSAKYKKVIIEGMIEHDFPQEHIEAIKNIPDNGCFTSGPQELSEL